MPPSALPFVQVDSGPPLRPRAAPAVATVLRAAAVLACQETRRAPVRDARSSARMQIDYIKIISETSELHLYIYHSFIITVYQYY